MSSPEILQEQLREAIIATDFDTVKNIIEKDTTHASTFFSKDECPALHFTLALMHEYDKTSLEYTELERIVYLLIEHGADIDATDTQYKITPLHLAIKNENTGILNLILTKNPNIESQDIEGKTPLHNAVEQQNTFFVRKLCTLGADIHKLDCKQRSPHMLAKYGDSEIREILERPYNLTQALEQFDVNAVEYYIKQPYYEPTQYNYFHYILNQACAHISNIHKHAHTLEAILKILMRHYDSSFFNEKDFMGETALHKATHVGIKRIVELFLKRGANPNIPNSNNDTALDLALLYDHPYLIQPLMQHGGHWNKTKIIPCSKKQPSLSINEVRKKINPHAKVPISRATLLQKSIIAAYLTSQHSV